MHTYGSTIRRLARPFMTSIVLGFLVAGAACGEIDRDDRAVTSGTQPGDTPGTTVPPAPTADASGPAVASDAGPAADTRGPGSTASPDGGASAGDSSADSSPSSAAAPTWTRIYSTVFGNPASPSNCMGAGCHFPGKGKGVDFSSAANGYRTVQSQLVPGAPDSSRLVLDLQSGRMPVGRPRLATADLDLVRAWIAAGAPNN